MLRSILTRLFAHRPAGAPAKRASFLPRLEALEGRLVPTISFHSVGDEVIVDGDYWGNDNLTVRAFGDGSFSVTDGTGATISAPAGKDLFVSTHWGNDTVRYIGGNFHGVLSVVGVDLGGGNDKFLGTFNRDIGDQAEVRLNVWGESGDDYIAVYGTEVAPSRSGDMITNGAAVNTNGLYLEEGSSLNVGIFGGGGNDKVYFDYDGQLDGTLDFALYGDDHSWGSSGDDKVQALLTLRQGSTGNVGNPISADGAVVQGGAGSDSLIFTIDDQSDGEASINAQITGNIRHPLLTIEHLITKSPFDYDSAIATWNVRVSYCETVTRV